jgi:leucyl-tRNA synthetase
VQLRQANHDYARGQFNTVVSAAMKMLNELARLSTPVSGQGAGYRAVVEEGVAVLLRVLAPIVPHVTHALWQGLGLGEDVLDAPWPQPDEAALARAMLMLAVQVNGKVRATIEVPADADAPTIEAAVLADERVRRHLGGKPPRRVVQVPGKLVNVVA